VVALLLSLSATSGLAWGDDPTNPDKRAGRLLVHALDTSSDVPEEIRFQGLLLVDPETGDSQQVGSPDLELGSLSPDGRFLAGVAVPVTTKAGADTAVDKGGVWVYDLTKPDLPRRKVFDRPAVPSWISDSSQLVLGAQGPKGGRETYRVKSDGSDLTKLPIPENEFVIDSTRDGRWLASFQTKRKTRENHILLTHPDGTGSREVVNEVGVGGTFQISPDGREVVYSVIDTEGGETKSTLWVIRIDGANRRQIPIKFSPGEMVKPRWSPDSSRLALGITWNGRPRKGMKNRIQIVDREGKNGRTLPLPPWQPTLLDWK
jgi:hypothetical protein